MNINPYAPPQESSDLESAAARRRFGPFAMAFFGGLAGGVFGAIAGALCCGVLGLLIAVGAMVVDGDTAINVIEFLLLAPVIAGVYGAFAGGLTGGVVGLIIGVVAGVSDVSNRRRLVLGCSVLSGLAAGGWGVLAGLFAGNIATMEGDAAVNWFIAFLVFGVCVVVAAATGIVAGRYGGKLLGRIAWGPASMDDIDLEYRKPRDDNHLHPANADVRAPDRH